MFWVRSRQLTVAICSMYVLQWYICCELTWTRWIATGNSPLARVRSSVDVCVQSIRVIVCAVNGVDRRTRRHLATGNSRKRTERERRELSAFYVRITSKSFYVNISLMFRFMLTTRVPLCVTHERKEHNNINNGVKLWPVMLR